MPSLRCSVGCCPPCPALQAVRLLLQGEPWLLAALTSGMQHLVVKGDAQLIIRQVSGAECIMHTSEEDGHHHLVLFLPHAYSSTSSCLMPS
eukprot:1149129-Pelagomonas_calceolata.AAC.3